MRKTVYVVDTNVVVSGFVSGGENPPAIILDAMLDGAFPFCLSAELLDEYSSVLRRPHLVGLHRRSDQELDHVLTDLVANAVWREPARSHDAPDPNDNHLWALLAMDSSACLVTGDQRLILNPPRDASVVSPRHFVELMLVRR